MNEGNKKIGGSYDISKIGHVIRVDTQTFNLLSKVRKNINMRKKIYNYKFDLKICQDCKM